MDPVARDPVILREDPLSPAVSGLGERLERLGFALARVSEEAELRTQLARCQGPQALLLNTSLSAAEIADSLAVASGALRSGRVTALAVGQDPAVATREALQGGGVTLAALGPVDDSTLRFQVNRAFLGAREAGQARVEVRAPWDAPVRLRSQGGEHAARLYNLSQHGAFLELVRPLAESSPVDLELPLESGPTRIPGQVVRRNAPGYQRQRRAPIGIGVHFDPLPEEVQAELDAAVASRSERLLL